MDKRTILRAFRATKALNNFPHGMKAGLQLVRLKRDLHEGEELDQAQRDAIESYGGLGSSLDEDEAEAFQREMQEILEGDAETDPDDIRPLDLSGFSLSDQEPDGQFGSWIEALIDVGCVDYDDAMALLDELED